MSTAGTLPSRTYDLSSLDTDHPAIWWREAQLAFATRAAHASGDSCDFVLALRTKSTSGEPTKHRWTLRSPKWLTASELTKYKNTAPEQDISEAAAIAIAGAVLASECHLRMTQVTLRGERGDYWLAKGKGAGKTLCEVSGTGAGALNGLFTKKKKQVLRNKRAAEAYVSVSRFRSREGRFCRVR